MKIDKSALIEILCTREIFESRDGKAWM
jgi:hypothetical protein